jgi:hypothetical protein
VGVDDPADLGARLVDDGVHGDDLGVLGGELAVENQAVEVAGGDLIWAQVSDHAGSGERKAVGAEPGAQVGVAGVRHHVRGEQMPGGGDYCVAGVGLRGLRRCGPGL